MNDFKLDLGSLKRTAKPASEAAIAKADAVGEARGFVDRSPRGKPGRKKSERTGQVHAKVLLPCWQPAVQVVSTLRPPMP